jgi:HEAT repeat protein
VSERSAAFGLSSDDRGRMEEVQRLARAGSAGAAELSEHLSDPSWVVRRAVVAALARIGTPAVRVLVDVLKHQRRSETRLAAAVDALVASTGEVELVLFELGDSTDNPAVICDVAQILGRRRSELAVPKLAGWCEHSDDNVAVAAIEALGRIGGPQTLAPLLAAVQSGNFFRTFAAISVLGEAGEPSTIEPLSKLLGEPAFAAEAAGALGRSGQLTAIPALAARLASDDDGTVRATARALFELCGRHAERSGNADRALVALRQSAPPSAPARLSQALTGASADDRLMLATALAWLSDLRAVPPLLELLNADGATAEHAILALRALGTDAEPLVRATIHAGGAPRARLLPLLSARRQSLPEFLASLADEDPAVRALACDGLARIGDTSVVGPLFSLLADPDAQVSQAAIAAVQSLGSEATKHAAIAAARTTDIKLRRAVLRVIAHFGYVEALDVLLESLDDADERVSNTAMAGLAMIEDARAASALLEALRHPLPARRAAACRALGNAARAAETIPALRAAIGDPDAWVRYYACQSLGKLHATEAAPDVARMLNDDAGQVRVAAVEAMARIGGRQALDVLSTAAGAEDGDVRRAALLGLGELRRPEAAPHLLVAAESSSGGDRLAAVSALAELSGLEVEAALLRAGSDPDAQVRAAAIAALAKRTSFAVTAWLVDRLSRPSERDEVVEALGQPVEGRIEGILAALEGADEQLSALLVRALLRMRRASGNAAVEAALHLENVHARRAAAAALLGIGTAEARAVLSDAAAADSDPEVRHIGASVRSR